MAGIYLHIPFCRKACHYCNFHFSTQGRLMPDLVDAMVQEMKQRKSALVDQRIDTLYFGGGTPSLLPLPLLETLMKTLHSEFSISSDAEITLEANPDDFKSGLVTQWRNLGVNRLSIGVQSFREADLIWMNRAHRAHQSVEAIEWAHQEGIANLTIDLIYGTPGLTDQAWFENVQQALHLQIPHLSCYALTVEPKTALQHAVETQQITAPDPEDQSRQFTLLMDWLEAAGFDHYEISNFGKKGFYSQHNRSYWNGSPYLGLGPSAHSFDGKNRSWNIANNALYIQGIQHQTPIREEEILTPNQQWNEYVMTALRTQEGIDWAYLSSRFPVDWIQTLEAQLKVYLKEEKGVFKEGRWVLTKTGKLFADGIAADLFRVD